MTTEPVLVSEKHGSFTYFLGIPTNKREGLSKAIVFAAFILAFQGLLLMAVYNGRHMYDLDKPAMSTHRDYEPHAFHPLDALTLEEVQKTVSLLKQGQFSSIGTRSGYMIHNLHVLDPEKRGVWAWTPDMPAPPRKAFVVLRKDGIVYEAIVRLDGVGMVESVEKLEGVQPILLQEEVDAVRDMVLQHPLVLAALDKRGVDPSDVYLDQGTVGNFNETSPDRKVRLDFYLTRNTTNPYARPLNLNAHVDLDKFTVSAVSDFPTYVPPPTDGSEYDRNHVHGREGPRPFFFDRPNGVSFKAVGNVISWQNWQFHVSFHPRMAAVVSTITYEQGGTKRPIAFKASLSEMFVPYQDPTELWYYKSFFDAGEYGFGLVATPLTPGVSCPDGALYIDGVFASAYGEAYVLPRAVCVFERYTGDLIWRHVGLDQHVSEERKAVELVVRSVSVVGYYDYVVDYVFRLDGSIRVKAGATGIDATKAVDTNNRWDASYANDTTYGHLISSHLVAPYHDHWLNFRIDLDVDGMDNSFIVQSLERTELNGEGAGLRKGIWESKERLITAEENAKFTAGTKKPTVWKFASASHTSYLGNPTAYEIKAAGLATLMSAHDPVEYRGRFIEHQLWVTQYHEDELYAGGQYPNQGEQHDDGLAVWTAQNRSLVATDLVAWVNIGFHHITRQEDFPVLPVSYYHFDIKPYDFFPRSPAIDLLPNY
eukprot:Colp12_sorted_trinity150504_noHs@12548